MTVAYGSVECPLRFAMLAQAYTTETVPSTPYRSGVDGTVSVVSAGAASRSLVDSLV